MPSPTLSAVRKAIRARSTTARAKTNAWFFKTGPGEYGEGDRFRGVSVPDLRKLARDFRALPANATLELLASAWHEDRLLALIILVNLFEQAPPADRKRIVTDYLANTRYINNWDLVDCSAAQIVGAHVRDGRSIALLRRLSRSKSLWERRIAMI